MISPTYVLILTNIKWIISIIPYHIILFWFKTFDRSIIDFNLYFIRLISILITSILINRFFLLFILSFFFRWKSFNIWQIIYWKLLFILNNWFIFHYILNLWFIINLIIHFWSCWLSSYCNFIYFWYILWWLIM